jgi:hypothetical protein
VALVATVAWAGPPAVVHTKNGVYYGELVERVEGDHITIKLATGVIKRVAWKDIDPSPVTPLPSVVVEDSVAAPHETVRTKSGAVYHGATVEHIPNDHITIELSTGEMKRFDWSDVDTSALPPPQSDPRVPGPMENVTTRNGSIYHGEIIEKVVGVRVTLKLATGDIKTLDWEDLAVAPPGTSYKPVEKSLPPPLPPTEIHFTPDKPSAVLQRAIELTTLCTGPCTEFTRAGAFRVTGPRITPSDTFQIEGGTRSIAARTGSRALYNTGLAFVISSAGAAVVAGIFGELDANACGIYFYCDRAGLDYATATLMTLTVATLVTGVVLLVTQRTHVVVRSVGRITPSGFTF